MTTLRSLFPGLHRPLLAVALLLPAAMLSATAALASEEHGHAHHAHEDAHDESVETALCHVCRVHDGESELEPVAATAEHDGTTYGFCSVACRDRFLEDPEGYVPPTFPRPAPAFEAAGLDGGTIALDDFRGRLVLLDFWATWCPPCIEDLPKLSKLHDRYAERGVTVLSVSIDEGDDALRKVKRMVRRRAAEHPVALDGSDAPAWAAYHVRAVPTQFLVDLRDADAEAGQIVAQWSGYIDLAVVEREIVSRLEDAPARDASSSD